MMPHNFDVELAGQEKMLLNDIFKDLVGLLMMIFLNIYRFFSNFPPNYLYRFNQKVRTHTNKLYKCNHFLSYK